eukprot:TRINITY_DN83886_c0_g1_i1.p1 TRINITY_DN83886_c0_g1~~TRINITY_DN83886_c0_g1_i1.p1  ORF type:complete len:159 (-),score=11.20 TRINITY_DN83886_c0_g1_i1:12-452(-)
MVEIVNLREVLSCQSSDVPDFGFFDPRESTTEDVVNWAILPFTRKKATSLATILSAETPVYPKCIVSHTWRNKFLHTVAAMVADALGQRYYFHIVPRFFTFDSVRTLVDELFHTSRPYGSQWGKTDWIGAGSINKHSVLCQRRRTQ